MVGFERLDYFFLFFVAPLTSKEKEKGYEEEPDILN